MVIPGGIAFAQENTGESTDITVTGIEPDDNPLGPVGSVDETLKVHNDVSLFFESNEEQIVTIEKMDFWDDHYVNSYSNVWNGQVEILFDELHENEIDQINEKLQTLYPGANINAYIADIALDSTTIPIEEDVVDLDNLRTKSLTHSGIVNHALINNGDKLETIDTFNVREHLTITGLELRVVVNHEDHDELKGYLEDPDGDLHRIFIRPRGVADGSHTWSVDLSDRYFSSLRNSDAFGTWKLKVGDYYAGSDTGSVVSWKLVITGTTSSTSPNLGTSIHPDPSIWELITDFFSGLLDSGVDKTCSFITDNCVPLRAGMPMAIF